MKYIQNLATVLILVLSLIFTGNLSAQASNMSYSVKLGQFVNPYITSFSTVKNLGYLYAVKTKGNTGDVYLGGFKSKTAADSAMAEAKSKGYTDAVVIPLNDENAEMVTVIQLGVSDAKDVNWDLYTSAGRLFAYIDGSKVKVLAGTYPDLKSAKAILPTIHRKGFTDAFVKNMRQGTIHEVTDFETGGTGFKWDTATPIVGNPSKQSSKPASYENSEITKGVPPNYNTESKVVVPTKTTLPLVVEKKTTFKTSKVPLIARKPSIRSKVKRSNVAELQKILKVEGTYNSTIDGYYGIGTITAFEETWASSRQLNKYKLLSEFDKEQAMNGKAGSLQYAINGLWDDSKNALLTLERSNEPLAKAYRAYWLYENTDEAQKIDELMNAAIKDAFANNNDKLKFDYTASYSYRDLGQLLQHLTYIQSVSRERVSVPCWMFERYQAQALQIFGTAADAGTIDLQDCGGFIDWEELQVLNTIANDLSAGSKIDGAKEAEYRSKAIHLFLAPVAPSDAEKKRLDTWQGKLMKGMNGWATQDPTLKELAIAFNLTFYQSYVLLEDYFAEKGYNAADAKGLALAALQSVLGPKVDRFI